MRRFAERRKMIDIPNARSSHSRATPRGGGLAIVASFSVALLCLAFKRLLDWRTVGVLLLSGWLVAAIGLIDDKYSLNARVRFVTQVVAAALFVLAFGVPSMSPFAALGFHYQVGVTVVALLALTWSSNLFNFMDGIDGIAGSEAVFFAGAAAWINSIRHGDPGLTVAMLCLAVVCSGFLWWNWPPAKIFMGDVGSGFLGLMLPMLALLATQHSAIPLQVWIILGGCFVVDASMTLARRVMRGERWFEAHRLHGYQHLARRWRSHQKVTLQYVAINVIWLLPWAWFANRAENYATLIVFIALLPLVILGLFVGSGAREVNPQKNSPTIGS
jgi:Fuc2NAc and GlcNAc transferase